MFVCSGEKYANKTKWKIKVWVWDKLASFASLLSFSICFILFFCTSSILVPPPPPTVLVLRRETEVLAVLAPSSPTSIFMNWSSRLISVAGRSCWTSSSWDFKSDTFGIREWDDNHTASSRYEESTKSVIHNDDREEPKPQNKEKTT